MPDLQEFKDYEIEGLPRTEANLKWLWSHFECTRCCQCCRIHKTGVRINRAEGEALAERNGVAIEVLVDLAQRSGETYIMPQPCRFLNSAGCSVHDIKPLVCREYPIHFRKSRGQDTSWVIITACPGGHNLLNLLLSGPQEGLEYRGY